MRAQSDIMSRQITSTEEDQWMRTLNMHDCNGKYFVSKIFHILLKDFNSKSIKVCMHVGDNKLYKKC